ncbi:MAG: hypothetical protein ICV69_08565 [Thermoleophilaceae bacterium]|nr:hypothetical protein [Thermoleophilaceae bacterium]
MRSGRLKVGGLCVAAALTAAVPAACGGTDDPQARSQAPAPKLAPARVIQSDPYAIACGHVRNQERWADVTRRATVAIADRERIRGLNRLQTTQSLFFAMTELCKGRPASYQPASAAVRGVQEGKFVADLGTP